MNKTVNITIRLNAKLKEDAEKLFSELGMNMTTGINIFLRQAIRDNGIPFKISASSANNKHYDISIDDEDIDEIF